MVFVNIIFLTLSLVFVVFCIYMLMQPSERRIMAVEVTVREYYVDENGNEIEVREAA